MQHMTLRQKLEMLRDWNGHKSRLDVAEATGMTLFQVWEFERGSSESMRTVDTVTLAKAYGVLSPMLYTMQDDEYEARLCGVGVELLPDLARRVLSQRNFVVLDLETTGKDNRTAEIVEIAIVGAGGERLLDSYVKPEKPIPVDAQRIHHITDDMVVAAPIFPEIFPYLVEILKDKLVIVYNADYDITVLQSLVKKHNLTLPEFEPLCLMVLYANHWRLQSKGITNKWQSLTRACEQQGVSLENAHSAMADTLATYRLLVKLAESDVPAYELGTKVSWYENDALLHGTITSSLRSSETGYQWRYDVHDDSTPIVRLDHYPFEVYDLHEVAHSDIVLEK